MSDERATPILEGLARKALTAEQKQRRRELAERTERMTTRGIPAPKNNCFGGKGTVKR